MKTIFIFLFSVYTDGSCESLQPIDLIQEARRIIKTINENSTNNFNAYVIHQESMNTVSDTDSKTTKESKPIKTAFYPNGLQEPYANSFSSNILIDNSLKKQPTEAETQIKLKVPDDPDSRQERATRALNDILFQKFEAKEQYLIVVLERIRAHYFDVHVSFQESRDPIEFRYNFDPKFSLEKISLQIDREITMRDLLDLILRQKPIKVLVVNGSIVFNNIEKQNQK